MFYTFFTYIGNGRQADRPQVKAVAQADEASRRPPEQGTEGYIGPILPGVKREAKELCCLWSFFLELLQM